MQPLSVVRGNVAFKVFKVPEEKIDMPAVGHFASLGTYIHSKTLVLHFLHLGSHLSSWGTKMIHLLRAGHDQTLWQGFCRGT